MAQSFKVIVVGESGTGKTTIIQRLINNTFRSESQATVGVDSNLLIVKLMENLLNCKYGIQQVRKNPKVLPSLTLEML